MMQSYNARSSSKKAHSALGPNMLILNTLRDRVRALGEMILEITDTALTEAEVLSQKIASSANGNAYMPLNNRICRNVLNTVVRSSRKSGKIVVSVSIVNTRDSNCLPAENKRSVESTSGRSSIAQQKRKTITTLRSGGSQAPASREASSVAPRQTNHSDDKPWRQKPPSLRSSRPKAIENRANSALKDATKPQHEASGTGTRKKVMWDEEIEQLLKDKPTAGNYMELIRRNEVSKTKSSTVHTDEGSPKPINSPDGIPRNGDGGECELFQCRAPVYDKSYELYVDPTQTSVPHDNITEEESTFYSCGFSSIDSYKKGSHRGKPQNGTGGKPLPSRGAVETLSGVYHLPGAILSEEAISKEEIMALLPAPALKEAEGALVSFMDHSRTSSLPFPFDASNPNSPNPRNPLEEGRARIMHFDSFPGSRSEIPPPSLAASFVRESSPQRLQIRPVLPGEPCCVQLLTADKNTSESVKEYV
ncbi:unnamed protein product [Phytomonas sp. EM1]|nr:unnamed protein product [Phytomonas sp. EM1]|eukprot:CCW60210.1 unnamed protein product [Phytomonas sp. isolate EM1]